MLAFLWGGARWPPLRVENEDTILAMREDLEAHGDFACKLDGTMEFIDFLTFRSIIGRQINRKIFDEKVELRKKQHNAFLQEDWINY